MGRIADFRRSVQEAAERVLAGRVYLLFAHELPREFRPTGTLGYTGRDLDAVLRPHLPGWRGRGVAVVIDGRGILGYLREGGRPRTECALRSLFAGIVCHELAHAVTSGWVPSSDDPLPDVAGRRLATARAEVFCTTPPAIDARPIRWLGHDGRFLRSLFHVAERLADHAAMTVIPGIHHETYGVSPLRDYHRALAGEPDRLAHVPLADLAGIPPPPAFASLWRSDLDRWFGSLGGILTTHQLVAFSRGLACFHPMEDSNMSEHGLMDDLTTEHQALVEQREGRHKDLIRTLGDGADLAPAEAAQILDDVRRTPEELREAVDLYRRRRAMRAQLDAAADLDKQAHAVETKIDKANGELERAEAKYRKTTDPLVIQLHDIKTLRARADAAAVELRRTAPEHIRTELERIGREAGQLTGQRNRLQADRDHMAGQVRTLESVKAKSKVREHERRGNLSRCKERLAECDAALADLDAQLATLRQRREALEAAQLQPI